MASDTPRTLGDLSGGGLLVAVFRKDFASGAKQLGDAKLGFGAPGRNPLKGGHELKIECHSIFIPYLCFVQRVASKFSLKM